jgi:alginate O-acetyltransferase complex protein AlgI
MVDSTLRVVLPLGISFYTFQALSYIIDVYRGEADAMEDFVDFSCFVSMFPHLVAGPILKFSFLAQQLRERTLSGAKFARGMAFFWMGLGKKVLLANPCAQMADASFDSGARSALEAWAGVVAYALQIYYDFSGYSDMAIGLGLMFGFYFAKNFNAPYRSTSVTEFWRRWHISLSSWLRDYLYIPLGGNRYGGGRTYLNLFVTMLLGGLWHGASWNYLIWGAWHGGVLAAERALKAAGFLKISGFAGGVFTSAVVLVGWVFFRSADLPSSLKYLSTMFGFGSISGESAVCWREPYLLFSFGVALLLVFLGKQTWDWTQRMTVWKVGAVAAIGGAGLVALLTQDYNPFIYYIF